MQLLASADEYEVVQCVRESYTDYFALSDDLFHLGLSLAPMSIPLVEQMAEQLCAFCGSNRCSPSVRFAAKSGVAAKVAEMVSERLHKEAREEGKNSQSPNPPLLLVLDLPGPSPYSADPPFR